MATLAPVPTMITTSNRRRFSSFDHLSGQEDFCLMYSGSERKHGWSARSMSSFNTEDGAGSTSTEPVSNTVQARERKQKEKLRFVSFTKVLMKFLEKKNPKVCKSARNVIQKYKSNKSKKRTRNFNGDEDASAASETMSVSVKAPLKQIVGPSYWKQAKGYLNQMEASENQENAQSNKAHLGNDFEPLSLDSNTCCFSETDIEVLSEFASSSVSNDSMSLSTCRPPCKRSCPSNENQMDEERKLRKQRFWMVVRVLMRYIEKNDSALHQKARVVLEDCERRNLMKEDHFTNLIECVQRELKHTVGTRYWRKAEQHVAKHLVREANEKAYEDALVKEAESFGSLGNFTPLPLGQQLQPIDPCSIEHTFAPPTSNDNDWRDPSIPANVTIPATVSQEDWASQDSYHEYQHSPASTFVSGEESEVAYLNDKDALYESQNSNPIEAPETNRKRRKLWRRPCPHFLNNR